LDGSKALSGPTTPEREGDVEIFDFEEAGHGWRAVASLPWDAGVGKYVLRRDFLSQ